MYDIRIAGENSLIIYLGDVIEPATANRVAALAQAMRRALGQQLIDLIPSYASLLVLFDPQSLSHDDCEIQLHACLAKLDNNPSPPGKLVELPVCYDGADLATVATTTGLSPDEVIELHCQTTYHCYAIGFAPGFAYLGQLNERLQLPRLDTPRKNVPAGSLAIAGQQTAIYPTNSPGGWHLIGRCPQAMLDVTQTPPCPISVGDQIRFVPIAADAWPT